MLCCPALSSGKQQGFRKYSRNSSNDSRTIFGNCRASVYFHKVHTRISLFPFFKSARHRTSFFRPVFVITKLFVHFSFASFCLWLKPFGQPSSIPIDACMSAIPAMAGPHGYYDQDGRMIRWGTDSHGWRKSDGGLGSNDN